MFFHVLLASELAVSTLSFAPAPIKWCGHHAKNFFVAPRTKPNIVFGASTVADPGQELTIRELPSKTFSNEIPHFTAKPDNTIAWDAANLCLEASGANSKHGDSIRLNRCTGLPNQLWNFLPSGHGRRSLIQLQDTNKCLEGGLPGESVELTSCTHTKSALWEFADSVPTSTAGQVTSPSLLRDAMMILLVFIVPVSFMALRFHLWSWRGRTKVRAAATISAGMDLRMDEGGVPLFHPMAMTQVSAPIRSSEMQMEMQATAEKSHRQLPSLDEPVSAAPPDTHSIDGAEPSPAWELDFYSRPVQGADGKLLWELLVTDETGSFQHVEAVPANCVSSDELRSRVQYVIASARVRPTTISFGRAQMKTMISTALEGLPGVTCLTSRNTYALYDWLEEPQPEVASPKEAQLLPDILRGETYSVASLPLAEVFPGGSISEKNIGAGKLCPIPRMDAPDGQVVSGIVMISKRATILAEWFNRVDLATIYASLETRDIYIGAGLDTKYLLAKIRSDTQIEEAEAFENGKLNTSGLHFFCVQSGTETDSPAGFWLLRDMSVAKGQPTVQQGVKTAPKSQENMGRERVWREEESRTAAARKPEEMHEVASSSSSVTGAPPVAVSAVPVQAKPVALSAAASPMPVRASSPMPVTAASPVPVTAAPVPVIAAPVQVQVASSSSCVTGAPPVAISAVPVQAKPVALSAAASPMPVRASSPMPVTAASPVPVTAAPVPVIATPVVHVQATDAPGWYEVENDWLCVAPSKDLVGDPGESKRKIIVFKGELIQVLGVVTHQLRRRARIQEPPGWITLVNLQTGKRFARKASPVPAAQKKSPSRQIDERLSEMFNGTSAILSLASAKPKKTSSKQIDDRLSRIHSVAIANVSTARAQQKKASKRINDKLSEAVGVAGNPSGIDPKWGFFKEDPFKTLGKRLRRQPIRQPRHPQLSREEEIECGKAVQKLEKWKVLKVTLSRDLGREPTQVEWAYVCGIGSASDFQYEIKNCEAFKHKMIVSNIPLVYCISKEFDQRRLDRAGLMREDIVQEGFIGLITVVEQYNPNKGKFSSFAFMRIKFTMQKVLDQGGMIRIPPHAAQEWRNMTKAEEDLTKSLGRKPTVAELAERLGHREQKIKVLRSLWQLQPMSLEALTLDGKGKTSHWIKSDDPGPLANPMDESITQIINAGLQELTVEQRLVFSIREGVEDGSPASWLEVAERTDRGMQRSWPEVAKRKYTESVCKRIYQHAVRKLAILLMQDGLDDGKPKSLDVTAEVLGTSKKKILKPLDKGMVADQSVLADNESQDLLRLETTLAQWKDDVKSSKLAWMSRETNEDSELRERFCQICRLAIAATKEGEDTSQMIQRAVECVEVEDTNGVVPMEVVQALYGVAFLIKAKNPGVNIRIRGVTHQHEK